MAGCHKNSMTIISEIPLCCISISFENRYLQAITVFSAPDCYRLFSSICSFETL